MDNSNNPGLCCVMVAHIDKTQPKPTPLAFPRGLASKNIQPNADEVAQNLGIIPEIFRFGTRRTRIL